MNLSLGFSPCPNDTFIFHALTHKLSNRYGLNFTKPVLADVETLNGWAMASRFDVTKLSFHALGYVQDEYELLASGSALGRGCGPLLVTKNDNISTVDQIKTVAIPGRYTTAALLLKLYLARNYEIIILPFERIMAAVAQGEVEAGVIIHESRFTYKEQGLRCLQDLGQWWEEKTKLPIPLGGIAAKRNLGPKIIKKIDQALKASIEYAYNNPNASKGYIQEHSQELNEKITKQHISLYVNDFSLDLGNEGKEAIKQLFKSASSLNLF